MVAANEAVVGRFIGWYRRTPVSLEFWEGVLTGERLIWCFVGESFKSMLLRADMGTYSRKEIASLTPDAVAEFDDQNVVISIENLQTIRLEPKSRFRRSLLTVGWKDGGFELESTRKSDPQEGLVESLAARGDLAHVDVSIERSLF